MKIIFRKPIAALANFIAIALSACGGGSSSSGDSGGGAAIDPPLTVPTISTPAENQSVVKGEAATFKVVATGSALTFQWKKNGTDIPGATSSSYTTPPTSSADNGAVFLVSVSNSAGSVSSNARLTVSDTAMAPAITSQPADQSAITGQTATFSVTATGTSISYQWQKNGTNITGATSSSYTTPAASMADSGARYSVSVSNSLGSITSNNATLTVTAAVVAPAITTQPAAQAVADGQAATFSVTATGTSPGYQWKKNGTDIPGATSSTYTIDATVIGDSGAVFSVAVSNSAGSATSGNATLTVSAVAPAITTQPAAQTVAAGQTATFSVTATGTAPLSYQWKKGGTDISGATSNTYTTPVTVIGDNNAVFTVVVSNSTGNITSNSATLTVNRFSLVANASGGFYDRTECVKDNNTGLIWEGKTASPATTRLGTSTYTNYDSTSSAQKSGGAHATQAEIDASTNSIGYVNAVNASGLCGYTDWRMPIHTELEGIVQIAPDSTIDTFWFPNTQIAPYWSATPYLLTPGNAVFVDFVFGTAGVLIRDNYYAVRLVRM